MRTIARFPIVIFALAVVLAIVAACSSDEPTATPTSAPPPATSAPATAAPATAAPATAMPATAMPATAEPTAMATAEPVEQPKYGGILRIGHRADPPAAWDTMRSTNYNLTPIAVAIAGEGNLVQPCWDDEQMICPGFAESWEANDDFTEWTFTIRDGATWHDGVPFTAEDVRWWVDLFVNGTEVGGVMREPGVAKGQFGDFKSVEVLNGNQVRITLNSSDAFYLDSLALHRIPIFHARHVFEPAFQAGNLEAAPLELGNIAAGPFKFVSYERGSFIELERYDDYWQQDALGNQLPFLDGLEYYIFADPSAFHAAFRTGRLDAGARGARYYVTPEQIPQYRESLGDDVYFLERSGGGSAGMGFNTIDPPFNDIRLREAISLWIDRQSSIDTLNQGIGRLRAGFLDTESSNPDYLTWPGYNPDTREADRARARQLIAEAGAEGLEFTIILPNTQVTQMEWWVGTLDGLGLKPELLVSDVTAFDERKAGTDWQATWGGGSLDLATPSTVNFLFGRKSESPYVPIVHEDPKISEIAVRLGSVTNNEDRQTLLQELELYVYQEQFYQLQASVGLSLIPVRSYVKEAQSSFILNPPTYASYSHTWIDK